MTDGTLTLADLVGDLAASVTRVDSRRPVWRSARSGSEYLPGIGPHPETEAVRLVAADLAETSATRYHSLQLDVLYPVVAASAMRPCDRRPAFVGGRGQAPPVARRQP